MGLAYRRLVPAQQDFVLAFLESRTLSWRPASGKALGVDTSADRYHKGAGGGVDDGSGAAALRPGRNKSAKRRALSHALSTIDKVRSPERNWRSRNAIVRAMPGSVSSSQVWKVRVKTPARPVTRMAPPGPSVFTPAACSMAVCERIRLFTSDPSSAPPSAADLRAAL